MLSYFIPWKTKESHRTPVPLEYPGEHWIGSLPFDSLTSNVMIWLSLSFIQISIFLNIFFLVSCWSEDHQWSLSASARPCIWLVDPSGQQSRELLLRCPSQTLIQNSQWNVLFLFLFFFFFLNIPFQSSGLYCSYCSFQLFLG